MLGGGIESLPEGATVVPIGDGLSFVMPWREFRCTPSQVARIEMAACMGMLGLALDDAALTAERRRLLGEVEDELRREHKRRAKIPQGRAIRAPADAEIGDGPLELVPAKRFNLPVTRDDDGARYTPEPYRPRDLARPAVMEKFDRVESAAPASARLDPGKLNDTQRRLLHQADDKLASAEGRKMARRLASGRWARMTQAERDERRFAQSAYQQLGLVLLSKEQEAEINGGLAEAQKRAEAEARAERRSLVKVRWAELMKRFDCTVPELVAEWRAYRLKLRAQVKARAGVDGLESLRDARIMTPLQDDSAEWYRDLYARTNRGARVAQMGAVIVGEERDREASSWGADQITIKAVEAKVMAASKNGRGLQALRLVVGQGRTLRSLAPRSGANQALYKAALLVALDVVADHRGLQ